MNEIVEEINIPLSESSDNMRVVYTVRHMTAQMGFDNVAQTLIATAVSELSTNVIRHAGNGIVVLKHIKDGSRDGFEADVEDNGPGIADVEQAMAENFSTGGGLGMGLASVKRIMDEFDIYSAKDQGTRAVARKWKTKVA